MTVSPGPRSVLISRIRLPDAQGLGCEAASSRGTTSATRSDFLPRMDVNTVKERSRQKRLK